MATTLSTPSIYAVDAFDPAYPHSFEFYYVGNQAVSNRAIITDNSTQAQVYNVKQDGLRLNHVLPANTLLVGHSYTIQIQVYDADGNQSNLSNSVLFYCFSTPQFYFSNVNDGDALSVANFELKLTYLQPESEPLSEYKYYVYDNTKSLLSTSESYYTDANLSYMIYGLKNNTTYYIRAIGKTQHGMSLDTGYVKVIIKYNTVKSNVLFEAINDKITGCIIIRTNILSVGYNTKNNNYTIENGEVHLENNILTYETGVDGDFCLIVKARKLPIGRFLYSTDGNISVSIVNICDKYYCNLRVKNSFNTYDIFKEIIGATVVDENGNQVTDENGYYITISDSETYDQNTMMAFEIYRKNNIYDIRASYVTN